MAYLQKIQLLLVQPCEQQLFIMYVSFRSVKPLVLRRKRATINYKCYLKIVKKKIVDGKLFHNSTNQCTLAGLNKLHHVKVRAHSSTYVGPQARNALNNTSEFCCFKRPFDVCNI